MITLTAPAKLNLSLNILGRRDDGFHEIDTLMVRLPGLADVLEIRRSTDFSFTCDDPTLPTCEDNLVVKAVRIFESATGKPCRCGISLQKVIPSGAGLGGGSSDAATTLLGLNQLLGAGLDEESLQGLAATLGSDVPFFLKPGAARCTGRGEIVQSVPTPPSMPVLLLKPQFGVATPAAYQSWMASIELPGIHYSSQVMAGLALVNDLERPVFQKHRFLAELKQWLLERPETAAALMSGSGSTIFAVLKDIANGPALAAAARAEWDPSLWTWTGRTE